MNYRPEIDGLRALAVLPVIFFHAGFTVFGGGFVGVDVFFVISGYLIASIIISEMAQDKFSLITFYERRARRILPALFFMMIVCIPFAWFWMAPMYISNFGNSLVAVSTFSSNILFWLSSGYFDQSSELNPLLHTWSLAVEEQYYIIFPLFLMLTWRFGTKFIIMLLAIVFLLSLGIAEWGAYNEPSASFFLLPTRGWELLMGVFASFYLLNRGHLKSKILNEIMSSLGFIMIATSIFLFDEFTPFPGLYALLPTTGTFLIIIFAVKNTTTYKVLSLPMFVSIGLISYSAYLWHQPVLAFSKYRFEDLSSITLLGLCFLSILAGYFSWRWVENPFRHKAKYTRAMIFKLSAFFILLFISVGLIMTSTKGLESLKIRYEFTEKELKNYNLISKSTGYDLYKNMEKENCKIWVKDSKEFKKSIIEKCFDDYGSPVIVLGDSHAMNIYNIFAKSDKNKFLLGVSQGGCRPHQESDSCHYANFINFIDLYENFNPKIIFHQSGSYLLDKKNENIIKVINYLNSVKNISEDVLWLGPYVDYTINPIINISEIKRIPDASFMKTNLIETNIVDEVTELQFKNFMPFSNFINITNETVINECLIWMDEDHFSKCGEEFIAKNANFNSLKTNQ